MNPFSPHSVGKYTLRFVQTIGNRSLFIFRVASLAPREFFLRFHLTVYQVYVIGVKTLSIIVISGLFVGMVLALQGYHTLVKFNSEESIGVLVALSLVRELGPVLASLLYAGRAGSSLTAEISLMKTTEQISAIEMMGVDPYRYIFAVRFAAGMIALPILIMIFIVSGIFGGYLVAVQFLEVDMGSYWGLMQQNVIWDEDVLQCMIKAVVFAFLVNWEALYSGSQCTPTVRGMGAATTQSVVNSSIAILAWDFVITALLL